MKVHNESGTTAELVGISPNGRSLFSGGGYRGPSDQSASPKLSKEDLWLDVQMYNGQPLNRKLSGLELEYRIVQLFSRDVSQWPDD